jgi:hypothetical protein
MGTERFLFVCYEMWWYSRPEELFSNTNVPDRDVTPRGSLSNRQYFKPPLSAITVAPHPCIHGVVLESQWGRVESHCEN